MSVKKISGYSIFLDKALGQGAFGQVYVGQKDSTKRPIAIKVLLKKAIFRDPYIRAAIISEIDILSCLKSPNIVEFFDAMESDNYYYIVQELCDGGDLRSMIRKRGIFPEAEAIGYLTQLCNGFVELIKQGVIHRDLKPENILINNGVLKLADFGFSKRAQYKAQNKTTLGTPLYMSLQLLKGQTYTSKCDIWALGLILYELVCGRFPWTAHSQYDLIRNIEQRNIKYPINISATCKDFISRCLKVTEEERWSWDQLLVHDIFKGVFTNKEDLLENKLKCYMRDIRLRVRSDNIDLERLWKKFGFTIETEMKFREFELFMTTISPTLTKDQVKYIFMKLDCNKNGSISFTEMSQELEKQYNIPRNSGKKIPQLPRAKSTQIHPATDQQIQHKLHSGFTALLDWLQQTKMSLNAYFAHFDTSKDGSLQRDQFKVVLKSMGFNFAEYEIQCLFLAIDLDQNGSISYQEFYTIFCKIVGQTRSPIKTQVQQPPRAKSPQPQQMQLPQQQQPQQVQPTKPQQQLQLPQQQQLVMIQAQPPLQPQVPQAYYNGNNCNRGQSPQPYIDNPEQPFGGAYHQKANIPPVRRKSPQFCF